MVLPAQVTLAGVLLVVPLSPLLIFGAGPVPAFGIAGGSMALLGYYLFGSLALGAWLASRHSLLQPAIRGVRLRWASFWDILRIGLLASIATVSTNLSIGIATALAGRFGADAIAGYGTAARLEYLMVPLMFGLGAPLLAIVGSCIGAGDRARAMHAAWAGAGIAFVIAESIGLLAAWAPQHWLRLFGNEPDMLAAGGLYLRTVGPCYGVLRRRAGAVLRLARGGAAVLAGGGQPRAARGGGGRRRAGAAVGWKSCASVHSAGRSAGLLRRDHRAGNCGRRLVWPHRLATHPVSDVAQDSRLIPHCKATSIRPGALAAEPERDAITLREGA